VALCSTAKRAPRGATRRFMAETRANWGWSVCGPRTLCCWSGCCFLDASNEAPVCDWLGAPSGWLRKSERASSSDYAAHYGSGNAPPKRCQAQRRDQPRVPAVTRQGRRSNRRRALGSVPGTRARARKGKLLSIGWRVCSRDGIGRSRGGLSTGWQLPLPPSGTGTGTFMGTDPQAGAALPRRVSQ